MRNRVPALILIGLLATSSIGCIQHEGQLAIYLTAQNQFNQAGVTLFGARQVNVEITSIAVRDVESGQYITLAQGSQVHEVAGLAGNSSLIALGDRLDQGDFTDIRVTFSNANSSVINQAGRSNVLLVQPSTITVPAFFSIVEDHRTSVHLQIDLAASLSQLNNGNWVLRPVLRQTTQLF